MEIPGLTRIRSASLEPTAGNVVTDLDRAKQEPSIDNSVVGGPKINADLQAKIEALRAQARQRAAESGDQQESRAIHQGEQSNATPGVNYSFLDSVLASHGLETVADSDDEMKDGGEESEEENEEDSSDVSSDSSDDDSDDDDSDDESIVQAPMTAEERERILIAADDNDGAATSEIPRTKNELAEEEEPVRVPDFEIATSEHVEPLGTITSVVGTACVVTGAPTPETKVLDIGSLLVFEDRKNLGYIADTFGPVVLPMFTVRFKSTEDMTSANVRPGRSVFFVPKHAVFVFSDTLRVKGTDASNIHDEEQSEVEFSDDEQEALYKSRKKQQRKAGKQGGQHHEPREVRPLNDLESIALAQGLTYDPAQNRVQPQLRTQADADTQGGFSNHPTPQRQQHNLGRGGQRGGRGTGRGRPETNNYGRGPDIGRQYAEQSNVPAAPFQRAFYQPDSHLPTATAQNMPPTATVEQSPTPTLYQPLKRPT